MEITPSAIDGCFILKSKLFSDERGRFVKIFHAQDFLELGLNTVWREQYWSASRRGVIRGLHLQVPPSDHVKLVSCTSGAVWDVAVDLRRGSPTFGRHIAVELTAENGLHMYLPRGMAHGFLALSEEAVLHYNVETTHDPGCDRGIRWDSCGIPWPIQDRPILSARDMGLPPFRMEESPF